MPVRTRTRRISAALVWGGTVLRKACWQRVPRGGGEDPRNRALAGRRGACVAVARRRWCPCTRRRTHRGGSDNPGNGHGGDRPRRFGALLPNVGVAAEHGRRRAAACGHDGLSPHGILVAFGPQLNLRQRLCRTHGREVRPAGVGSAARARGRRAHTRGGRSDTAAAPPAGTLAAIPVRPSMLPSCWKRAYAVDISSVTPCTRRRGAP